MAVLNVDSVLKIDSRDWHEQLAKVVAANESTGFPATLVSALRHVVKFDNSVWFVFRGQERPVCVYDTFTPKQRVIFGKGAPGKAEWFFADKPQKRDWQKPSRKINRKMGRMLNVG